MCCALSGTLFIYQGQELGMTNFPIEWDMSEYKDVDSSNYVSRSASFLLSSSSLSYRRAADL